MQERKITFEVLEREENGTPVIAVRPRLINIWRDEGGERIVLAIVCNCLRMIAKREGVEHALERVQDLLLNHTKPMRDDWPWNK